MRAQALVGTISYLERKKEENKLLLFRRFRSVLVLAIVFSVAWTLYTMVASAQVATSALPWTMREKRGVHGIALS